MTRINDSSQTGCQQETGIDTFIRKAIIPSQICLRKYASQLDITCIVDERGKLVLDDVYNGFDDDTLRLLDLEVKEVPEIPDPALSVQDMKDYGYAWAGVLPAGQEAAEKALEKGCEVYRLYSDNTESLCVDAKEIADHAAKGGMLGISKESWMAALEKENYLKAAEMSMEDDYGMIDGIINNGPKEDKTVSVVEAVHIRDREFEPFAFRINEEAMPEPVGSYLPKEKKTGRPIKGPFDPDKEIPKNVHRPALDAVFANGNISNYDDYIERLKEGYGLQGIKLGYNKAVKVATLLSDKQMVIKEGKDYAFNPEYHY